MTIGTTADRGDSAPRVRPGSSQARSRPRRHYEQPARWSWEAAPRHPGQRPRPWSPTPHGVKEVVFRWPARFSVRGPLGQSEFGPYNGGGRRAVASDQENRSNMVTAAMEQVHGPWTLWGSRMSHIRWPAVIGAVDRPGRIASGSLRLLCLIFQHMLGLALLTGAHPPLKDIELPVLRHEVTVRRADRAGSTWLSSAR